jgi:S1-C subfamily serine protease
MKFNAILFCLLFGFAMFVGAMMVPVSLDSDTVPNLVAKTLPAIVELHAGFANLTGAGVLISEDGWVMTAGHLVENQDVMIVTLPDGSKYMSINIIADPNNDIAILKIDIGDAPHVRMSKVYPRWGAPVYAIGHPLGLLNNVSHGIVSNVHTDYSLFGTDLIITDTELTWGNSGGGLFSMDGCLLGITVGATLPSTGIEMNLVVPVARGRGLLEKYVRQQEISTDPNSLAMSLVP